MMKLLDPFGPFVARYEGVGDLQVENIQVENIDRPISFEAVQTNDGTLLVAGLLKSNEAFWSDTGTIRGFTQDPTATFVAENIWITSFHFSAGMASFVGRCPRFRIVQSRIRPAQTPDELALVNLRFERADENPTQQPTPIRISTRGWNIEFVPAPEYRSVAEGLRATGGVARTATCLVSRSGEATALALDERLMDSLLFALSLLVGTKVVWLSSATHDEFQRPCIVHRASHTKPMSRELTRLNWQPELDPTLQNWLNRARPDEEMTYQDQMIDFFLDALGQTDMETRALTAASLIDALVTRWAERNGDDDLLSKQDWVELRGAMKSSIEGTASIAEDLRLKLIAKLGELNRKSFQDRLAAMLVALDLPESGAEAVKNVRNRLVHAGRFPAKVAPSAGYTLLIGTAYAILLRSIGYAGDIPLASWGLDS